MGGVAKYIRNASADYKEANMMATYSEDTKLGELLADPAAVAILDEVLPGATSNPMLGMAKGFTLKQIAAMPQAGIAPEKATELLEKLNAQLG